MGFVEDGYKIDRRPIPLHEVSHIDFEFQNMATTSETIIIKLHPIKEGLTIFCHLFETTCEDLGISLSSDAVPVVFSKTTNLGISQCLGITCFANDHSEERATA